MARLRDLAPGEQYTLEELTAAGNTVQFHSCRKGQLWYEVCMDDMDFHRPGFVMFRFPINVADLCRPVYAVGSARDFAGHIEAQLERLKEE